MHYESVSWDSREFWEAIRREDYVTAADIAPIWGVALSLAAGPLVSYAMVAGCCYGCVRWRPYAVLVAVGYLCPLRLLVGVQHGVQVLLGGDPPASYDELRVAALTGIPVQVLVGFGVAVVCILRASATSSTRENLARARGLIRGRSYVPDSGQMDTPNVRKYTVTAQP